MDLERALQISRRIERSGVVVEGTEDVWELGEAIDLGGKWWWFARLCENERDGRD